MDISVGHGVNLIVDSGIEFVRGNQVFYHLPTLYSFTNLRTFAARTVTLHLRLRGVEGVSGCFDPLRESHDVALSLSSFELLSLYEKKQSCLVELILFIRCHY